METFKYTVGNHCFNTVNIELSGKHFTNNEEFRTWLFKLDPCRNEFTCLLGDGAPVNFACIDDMVLYMDTYNVDIELGAETVAPTPPPVPNYKDPVFMCMFSIQTGLVFSAILVCVIIFIRG
jgi:hypothetical protein